MSLEMQSIHAGLPEHSMAGTGVLLHHRTVYKLTVHSQSQGFAPSLVFLPPGLVFLHMGWCKRLFVGFLLSVFRVWPPQSSVYSRDGGICSGAIPVGARVCPSLLCLHMQRGGSYEPGGLQALENDPREEG